MKSIFQLLKMAYQVNYLTLLRVRCALFTAIYAMRDVGGTIPCNDRTARMSMRLQRIAFGAERRYCEIHRDTV